MRWKGPRLVLSIEPLTWQIIPIFHSNTDMRIGQFWWLFLNLKWDKYRG